MDANIIELCREIIDQKRVDGKKFYNLLIESDVEYDETPSHLIHSILKRLNHLIFQDRKLMDQINNNLH